MNNLHPDTNIPHFPSKQIGYWSVYLFLGRREPAVCGEIDLQNYFGMRLSSIVQLLRVAIAV